MATDDIREQIRAAPLAEYSNGRLRVACGTCGKAVQFLMLCLVYDKRPMLTVGGVVSRLRCRTTPNPSIKPCLAAPRHVVIETSQHGEVYLVGRPRQPSQPGPPSSRPPG